MNLTLLPTNPQKRSILDELTHTIHQAQAVYGAVCFWSIGPDILPGLAILLSQPGSFCIADIHLPTNVDKLNLFHRQGGSIYLFFKELNPKRPDAYLQRHLLHTKMLLFDLPNGQAELWVGSHNFTQQALKGINREASLVIPCQQGDALYTQTRTYLQSILDDSDCHAFNPALLDTYKRLQGLAAEEKENGVEVLRVAWRSSELPNLSQQVILLAGHDTAEASQFALLSSALTTGRAQLAVLAFDLDGGPSRKFTATIHNQGTITSTDPATYDVAFGERHLAVRIGTRLPLIATRQQQHAADTLRQFAYWVSIRIGDELPAQTQFIDDTAPVEAQWKTDKEANQLLSEVFDPEAWEPREGFRSAVSELRAEQDVHDLLLAGRVNEESIPRLVRWLGRARHRRLRAIPTAPSVVHVEFRRPKKALPGSLAELEAQFSPGNLLSLQEEYEQPLLDAVYSSQPPSLITSDEKQGPQVRKLLKRYVVR